ASYCRFEPCAVVTAGLRRGNVAAHQIRALLLRQPLDHGLRQRLGFHRAFNGIALHPHPGLEAFDRERAVLEQAVMHVEARAAQRRDRPLGHDLVAEPGGDEKAGMGVDQRMADEVIGLEVIVLAHAERALDQRRRAGVEHAEIARVIDDPGGIAIAPFDAHEAAVDEHALSSRSLSAGQAAARRRGGSPRRWYTRSRLCGAPAQRTDRVGRAAWETAPPPRGSAALPAAAPSASGCEKCPARWR